MSNSRRAQVDRARDSPRATHLSTASSNSSAASSKVPSLSPIRPEVFTQSNRIVNQSAPIFELRTPLCQSSARFPIATARSLITHSETRSRDWRTLDSPNANLRSRFFSQIQCLNTLMDHSLHPRHEMDSSLRVLAPALLSSYSRRCEAGLKRTLGSDHGFTSKQLGATPNGDGRLDVKSRRLTARGRAGSLARPPRSSYLTTSVATKYAAGMNEPAGQHLWVRRGRGGGSTGDGRPASF